MLACMAVLVRGITCFLVCLFVLVVVAVVVVFCLVLVGGFPLSFFALWR